MKISRKQESLYFPELGQCLPPEEIQGLKLCKGARNWFSSQCSRAYTTGLLIIKPPLRIFELRNFPKSFIIHKKSGNFFVRFLLFTKKIRLRRAFIIYKISEAQIWALRGRFFHKNDVFALKYPQKNFRLRRAGETLLLLVPKKISLRRAFIINKIPKSICFYYLHKILQSFLSAFIIFMLRGVNSNSPVVV